jgi:hypothetical protein
MKNSLVAALCLLVAGTVVSAQSLVEVAKKEKERRKKVESRETHSYNERDLKSNGLRTAPPSTSTSSSSTTASDGSASASADSSKDAAAPEDPTETQAYWHDKVSALDKKIQDLQTRLASPEMTANTRGASERQKVEKDLAQAKADKDALADEARRKGVPPGWLR